MITKTPALTSEPTLPASWYHSVAMYELERRAIFGKKWLQITHKSRFTKTGDYVKYEMAGYHFFIIREKDGNLKAFHNICRHRAFPVIQKEEGNASIIACGYHGWSYGINGNLAKAPRFNRLEEFKKEDYSLWSIHLHIDQVGFVWVNLDASENPTSWEEQCNGADTQERLGVFDMDEYHYDHSWSMDGPYNWKTLIDNYNECYHCMVAHPGIAATTDLPNYAVETGSTFIAHFARPKPEYASGNNSNVAPTFLFPAASSTINTVYMYLMRVVPTSPTSVSMQYEVYRHTKCSDEEFAETDAFMKQIENEDRVLCTAVQRNLGGGVYATGPLHPENEKGVRYFKELIKKAVMGHREEEEKVGREIWPARREMKGEDSEETQKDEAFCKSLCGGETAGKLAW